ncbi:MAG: hypothetical protein ACSLEW_09650 [Nocardioides sp.]
MSDPMPEHRSGAVLHTSIEASSRIGFERLVRVEWRKMHDTRAGFWLLLLTGLLLGVFMVVTLLVGLLNDDVADAISFAGILTNVMIVPVSLLVPVLAITSVTSEWSQRTALTTFTLEPSRGRILAAKAAVSVLIALATIVVALACAAAATAIIAGGQGTEANWSVDVGQLLVVLLVQVLVFMTAFGLGMCFLSSPAAIAVFYAATLILPLIGYAILFILFDWFATLIPWLDLQYASMPWTSDRWPDGDATTVDGLAVARLASASLIWLVLPLGLGARRILRAEVK